MRKGIKINSTSRAKRAFASAGAYSFAACKAAPFAPETAAALAIAASLFAVIAVWIAVSMPFLWFICVHLLFCRPCRAAGNALL